MSPEMTRCPSHTRRAATLAELLLVVGIVAVLAGLAAPRYARATERRRFESAAFRLQADVALARERARTSSATRTLRFSVADNSYQLLTDEILTRGPDPSVQFDQPPYNADITYADFGGAPDLVFDGYGRLVTGGEVRIRVGRLRGRIVFSAMALRAGDNTDGDPDGGVTIEIEVDGAISPTSELLRL